LAPRSARRSSTSSRSSRREPSPAGAVLRRRTRAERAESEARSAEDRGGRPAPRPSPCDGVRLGIHPHPRRAEEARRPRSPVHGGQHLEGGRSRPRTTARHRFLGRLRGPARQDLVGPRLLHQEGVDPEGPGRCVRALLHPRRHAAGLRLGHEANPDAAWVKRQVKNFAVCWADSPLAPSYLVMDMDSKVEVRYRIKNALRIG
jgi:hypothetical protein